MTSRRKRLTGPGLSLTASASVDEVVAFGSSNIIWYSPRSPSFTRSQRHTSLFILLYLDPSSLLPLVSGASLLLVLFLHLATRCFYRATAARIGSFARFGRRISSSFEEQQEPRERGRLALSATILRSLFPNPCLASVFHSLPRSTVQKRKHRLSPKYYTTPATTHRSSREALKLGTPLLSCSPVFSLLFSAIVDRGTYPIFTYYILNPIYG